VQYNFSLFLGWNAERVVGVTAEFMNAHSRLYISLYQFYSLEFKHFFSAAVYLL